MRQDSMNPYSAESEFRSWHSIQTHPTRGVQALIYRSYNNAWAFVLCYSKGGVPAVGSRSRSHRCTTGRFVSPYPEIRRDGDRRRRAVLSGAGESAAAGGGSYGCLSRLRMGLVNTPGLNFRDAHRIGPGHHLSVAVQYFQV